jgi:hypothetical protein
MPRVERLIAAGSLHPPKQSHFNFVELCLWVLLLALSLGTLAYWGS